MPLHPRNRRRYDAETTAALKRRHFSPMMQAVHYRHRHSTIHFITTAHRWHSSRHIKDKIVYSLISIVSKIHARVNCRIDEEAEKRASCRLPGFTRQTVEAAQLCSIGERRLRLAGLLR